MRRSTLAEHPGGIGLPGYRIASGGVSSLPPGAVSHGNGRHTHPDPEIFIVLSGTGVIHLDGEPSAFAAGDVLVVEAGEDHHLEAVTPVVTTWLHLEPGR
ncbi:cupin domain-containing protein [Nonomuraea longicatena]|uniref:Cupin type-2 domain-containing protein n=1 Tax=Nonomuraea longicatena TaxID=83682 RepID=A0ABN1PPV2_9ACTN